MHIFDQKQRGTKGFTIVELIVVVSIVAILATISIVGYGSWRTAAISAQLKSDLSAMAAAMEDSRTFNNGYPATLPDTVTPSDTVTLTLATGSTAEEYCIDAVSTENASVTFYIASESKDQGALEGTCATRPGQVLPSIPSGLAVTSTSSSSVGIMWNASSNSPLTYTAQCASDAAFVVGLQQTTQASTSTTVSNLMAASTHYCRVKATNGAGDSAWSSTVSTNTENTNYWVDIKVGFNFAVAKKTDGSLWAWGSNSNGKVGNGSTVDQPAPVMVIASGVSEYYVTIHNVFVIKTDGSLWAWGDNLYGLVGNNSANDQLTPVEIIPSGVTNVYVTLDTSTSVGTIYVRKTDGSLWSWGYNSYGAVGNGGVSTVYEPVQIMPNGVVDVYKDIFTVYVKKTDGSLWAWGRNSYGQVGNGLTTSRTTPYQVFASGISAAYVHKYTAYVLQTNGSLWSFGYNRFNATGNGGDPLVNQLTPIQIIASGVSVVKPQWYGAHVIKTDGSVWGWGWNRDSQVGNGTSIDQATPVQVIPDSVAALSAEVNFSITGARLFAIKSNGSLWGWGENQNGTIGNNSQSNRSTPFETITSGVSSVHSNYYSSLAIRTDDTLLGWGPNTNGQLGNGSFTQLTPVQISSDVSSVATSYEGYSLYVLKNDGSLWVNGENDFGQLGVGYASATVTSPVKVPH